MAQMGYVSSLGWSHGVHSLKTGEKTFDAVTGMAVWDYLAQHPEEAQTFSQSRNSIGTESALAVADSYDFSGMNTIVDVGGGRGSLLSTIVRWLRLAEGSAHLNGILFDLPDIIAIADVDETIQPVAGNFFESVPTGGDAYLMRWILHDWDDEKSSLILKSCHQAMPDHAKLLLIESIIPPGNEPSPAKFGDMIMLLLTGGRERSEEEYRSLLRSSGFELTRLIPTPSMLSIIEAVKL